MRLSALQQEILRLLESGGPQSTESLTIRSRLTKHSRRVGDALLSLKDAERVTFRVSGLWALVGQDDVEHTIDDLADAIVDALAKERGPRTLHDLMDSGKIPRAFGKARQAARRLIRTGEIQQIRGVGFAIADGGLC